MRSTPSMSLNQLIQVWFFWGKDVWTCPILVSLKQPVHSNQVATMACAGLGGAGELHASNVMMYKVVLLVTEIQDLNPGVWSGKAAMPNSSDQMSVLLPAVASTDFMLQSSHLCQLMGEWFSWKCINSKALFFQEGKNTGIKSLEVRYLTIHTCLIQSVFKTWYKFLSNYCLTTK